MGGSESRQPSAESLVSGDPNGSPDHQIPLNEPEALLGTIHRVRSCRTDYGVLVGDKGTAARLG